MDSAPQRLSATNCLKVGSGPFLLLAHAPKPQQAFQTLLKQVTLRDADSLCDVRTAGATMPIGTIQIESNDSVFHFRNESSCLLNFLSEKELKGSDIRVDVGGEGTISSRGFDVAAWINTVKPGSTPLNGDTIVLDGILAVPFEFAGPPDDKPQNSAVRGLSSQGPRRSMQLPGIDAARLNAGSGAETARVD
jgi:hypothetical protein